MKKIFLVIVLLLVANFTNAQDINKASCDCETENLKLPDNIKFQKALKDASIIKPTEKQFLQKLPKSETIKVISLRGRKNDDKPLICSNEGLNGTENVNPIHKFVALPEELRNVYQTKTIEFLDRKNRLEKLLGLSPDYTYDCFVVFEIKPEKLIRPTFAFDWEGNFQNNKYSFFNKWILNDYPFTALGYTCDWYYGDGCRYGLTEFFIDENTGAEFKKICSVDDFLDQKCNEK